MAQWSRRLGILHARNRVRAASHSRHLLLRRTATGGARTADSSRSRSRCFLLTVLAVWPAAILRLSFVKAYAVMAYLAVSRDSAWGNAGLIEIWRDRIFHSPLEWMLILAGVLVWLRNRSAGKGLHYPVGPLRACMLVATLRVLTDHAAIFAGVRARAGSARWPRAGSFNRSFAEASQFSRRNSGCCGTLWQRLVSGSPPAPQSKSPFGGGCDIYTPK